jgi:hypothetical protein
MRHEFHPEALAEFEAAARHYADCQDGLELRSLLASKKPSLRLLKPHCAPAFFPRMFDAA